MRNTNKKGFTIVELVIVVAVIAILAAVLIPTFSGIITKARYTADQKAVREMNNAIAMESATTLDAAIAALEKHGINAKNLIPVSAGYSFVWNETEKKIDLVKGEDKENIADSIKEIAVVVNTTEAFLDAIDEDMKYIKLDADVNIDSNLDINGENVTIDLNGKKITTTQVTGRSAYLNVKGSATFVNGTIEARGIQVYGKLTIAKDANVTVANVDSNGGAALWIYKGAEVEINGGTFTALNGAKDFTNNFKYNPGVINNDGKLTINSGTFKSAETVCYVVTNSGEMVINGGTFEGTHGVVANSGTATINGGTFTVVPYEGETGFDGHVVYSPYGNVTVNGGTFNGGVKTFFDSTESSETTDTGIITDKR